MEEEMDAYTRACVKKASLARVDEVNQILESLRAQILTSMLKPYAQKQVEDEIKLFGLEKFIIKRGKQKEEKKKIYFLTVSFRDTASFSDIQRVVHKFTQLKYIDGTNWAYTYEQRSEDQFYIHGIHMHFMFDKLPGNDNKHCKLINRIYSTFKTVVTGVNYIDLKIYPASFRSDKIKYMTGEKWDKDKQLKVDIDKIWRKNNNLRDIYYEDSI